MLNPTSALAAAIELGRQGYSCFPCRDNKKPFPDSHGCLDASTVDDDLKALWSQYPGPLIGVATGPPSHFCVVDIDAKHKEAHEWWIANKARLLPTRVHRTRSGGLHLLYGDHDGLRNSTSKICRGVDVRGNGGYICWWPAAGCAVLSDAPIAPWPDWLEWLVEPPQPAISTRSNAIELTPGQRRARLEGLIASVLKAVEGNRNAVLFWAACTVHEVPDLLAHERDEAIEALFQAGRDIGLHNIEINRTLRSAERRVG